MRGLGDLEAKIMERLWSSDQPQAVRDVMEHLQRRRGIAYTTVMTVMDNLHRKGLLQRELDGRAYRYRPSVSREDYAAGLMREALTAGVDHSGTLMRFAEKLTAEESAALRRAMRRAQAGKRASGAGR